LESVKLNHDQFSILPVGLMRSVARCIVAAIAAASLVISAHAESKNAFDIPLSERQIRAAGIEFARVEPEGGSTEITLPGVIVTPPHQLHVIAAPAASLVEAMFVSLDEAVTAGQPIARLRSTELVEAQRRFVEALSAEALARDRLMRDEFLYREKAIPEARARTTRAEAEYARATLDEREQMLALLGMAEDAIAELRRTRRLSPTLTITAPIDGTILQRQATAGERVTQASPLFTVAKLDPLWVQLQVPLARAAVVAQASRISIPTQGGTGVLVRVGRSADAGTQSTSAIAEIDNGAQALRPGQAVTAAVVLPQNGSPQWRVPAGSVVRHNERSWVFVRTPSGFLARLVTVLGETAQTASIRGELQAQDQIAVRGILTLLSELAAADGS
jgi:cobalt-zinc-cadmium efflux system membrane fusion protein